MRWLIELTVAISGVFICYYFAEQPNISDFWKNIAFSTASACIFYIFFNIIPGSRAALRKTVRYFKFLNMLFSACAAFDKHFKLVNKNIYTGASNEALTHFERISVTEENYYYFVGRREHAAYGTFKETVNAFATTLFELINTLEDTELDLHRNFEKHFFEIKTEAKDFFQPTVTIYDLQPTRIIIFEEADKILSKIHKNIFYSLIFKEISIDKSLEFEHYSPPKYRRLCNGLFSFILILCGGVRY